ncbi:hypothetical protein BCR33DRAFT_718928 [Rhizoclosmatium globosum]|uniref:B30.2/SPRY domain-containing protein n=1 Tax=Rhizoclosmatium globosum TaxID=329046 RepID=A0A1Y2C2M8_9FUNG|nr:hypothetical protein BCR33DRAFT_718928 [Rhizoclosmatium globosum]|eukprot:ORY41290.1 hypothetical protein BCR33DRAFT_718928 [Rhizoclosmatium globosum]
MPLFQIQLPSQQRLVPTMVQQMPQLQPQQQQRVSPPCYCGAVKETSPLRPPLKCRKCTKLFHQECIESFKTWAQPPFLGDDFFVFYCKGCSSTQPPSEKLSRTAFILSDIAHLALFQLTHQSSILPGSRIAWSRESPSIPPVARLGPNDDRLYFTRKQVAAFVDANWDRFWLKNRAATWTHSLMSAIQQAGGGVNSSSIPVEELRFLNGKEQFDESGSNNLIALFNKTALPSSIECRRSVHTAFDILPDGTLVDLPGAAPRPPQAPLPVKNLGETAPTNAPLTSTSGNGAFKKKETTGKKLLETGDSDNESINSNNIQKKEANESRKTRVSKPKPQPRLLEQEEVDVANSVLLYPDLHNPECGPVLLSTEVTHCAPQMKISADRLTVFTDKGYRMAKATHGVYEGCWYYEVTFNSKEKGHARVGWSQISGDLQAPCGYDQFSYSFRDSPGTLFHESRPVSKDGIDNFSEGYKDGDVLGVMITLPTPSDMDNLVRRLWKVESSYVQFRTKPLVKMHGSEIRYFKNGVELGVAFTDLYNGKYYPAVSSYMHGTLTLNFGPNFKYPLPPNARPYSDVPKVFAWSDLSLYSYEPFFVYDKEFPPVIQAPQFLDSPPNRKREIQKFREFGARKRKLVKKRNVGVASGSVAANSVGPRVSTPDFEKMSGSGGGAGSGAEDEEDDETDGEGDTGAGSGNGDVVMEEA